MDTTTRKLAAIMFTDIIGYTRLMGSDEEKAVDMLSRNRSIHQSCIEKFNGTLIKEIGDGILVSFSLASEAVRCAIEIQKECKDQDIPLKIGIHEGEMIFSGSDVIGDGVNIASRLQEDAQEGCINISASVYREIKNKADIKTKLIGEKSFKNVDEPIKVYQVFLDKKGIDDLSKDAERVINQGRKIPYFVISVVVIFVIIVVLLWRFLPSQPNVILEKSIAVRPFWNESANLENEYFVNGMTEDIRNNLTKIADLRVLSRGSVEKFKNSKYSNKEIARQLDVTFVLEGTVQRLGNRIKIHVQLILPENEDHIWEATYDKEIYEAREIFDIQSQIAKSVADGIKVIITPNEKKQIENIPTYDLEAYEEYLLGRFYWNKRTRSNLNIALIHFQKAVELDSNFVLAYVGIGDVYSIASAFGFMNSKEGHLKALESSKSALNLNPNLAEAMITKARSTGFLYFDWDEVFKEYEEALLLQPNYVIGRYWYAWLLSGHKKFDLAEYQINYANRIEPLSPTILSAAGWMALVNDSTDKAKSILEKALSIDPSFARTHFWLGQTLVFIGKYEKGLSHIEQSVELSNNNPLYIANQIFCLCEAGKLNDAETLYSSFFEAMSKNELEGYLPSYDKAIACIGLNKKEQALDFLEESYENRDSWIVYMAVDPRLSSLRNEARFKNLIEKVGLPNK